MGSEFFLVLGGGFVFGALLATIFWFMQGSKDWDDED